MRRARPAVVLVVVLRLTLVGAASAATVPPSKATTCFRSSHWHAAVQTLPGSVNLTAIGRFYRGGVPELNGWVVHFYANRVDLEREARQLRDGLAAPFAAVLVTRGLNLVAWEGPNLPTRADKRLRDRCFPT